MRHIAWENKTKEQETLGRMTRCRGHRRETTTAATTLPIVSSGKKKKSGAEYLWVYSLQREKLVKALEKGSLFLVTHFQWLLQSIF